MVGKNDVIRKERKTREHNGELYTMASKYSPA